MATITATQLHKEVATLKQEIQLIRSFLISLSGNDPEGSYNPKFVKEIRAALSEKPTYIFKDAQSFLALLNKE
jgi:hypothetical protein